LTADYKNSGISKIEDRSFEKKEENKKSLSLKANARQGQAQLPVPRGNDDVGFY
jgi:hypothetical protein